ncbi:MULTISPECIES: glutamate ABC transporter substrate-binding protein [Arsenicicoccus]|uniref:Glutamate ABC transporter substrate-binding protein n=1 Tax=Arsenicicoccus bolidensis TaxID=229480 RepID=A0ABS9Q0I7_9MICO|nr:MULTISPECIES: glutamate ABC transporter substrate-binding protein [Arsenicicoccus]MCG7320720.1 glutamate ABC transporter substrate-binding protein [Arsenicicoccus bolidensis]
MTIRRTTTAAAAIALAATSIAACGSSSSSSGSGSSGAASGAAGGETIKVGIKFDQPGLGLKEGSSYSGFDVDLAKYIAKEMGKTPEFVEAVSAQREATLQAGKVAYIVGTYSITDKRKEKVSFAGPYFVAGQDLLVRADDTSITGPDALSGKKLCSVKGSTSATKIKDQYPNVQLQEYDTYSKCVEALSSGSIDALSTDNTILAGYAGQSQYQGKLKVVGKTFSTENYGVGVKKGDTATCQKVTDAINKYISSGEWQKAVDKNLGTGGFKVDTSKNPPKPAACA